MHIICPGMSDNMRTGKGRFPYHMEAIQNLNETLHLCNATWSLPIQEALILPCKCSCVFCMLRLAHAQKVVDVFSICFAFIQRF